MGKWKAWMLVVVAVGAIGLAGLLAGQDEESDFEFVQESEYPIAAGSASMQTYDTLESLFERAVLVAEVKIKDQETVYISENPPSVLTWSDAEIKQIFKGEESLKTVKISESGGVLDQSIETTIEGSPVMKKGNTYLVFLKESAPGDPYTIVGTIQGKVRIDDASNKGVVTIDPERFAKQMDLFWLQRKFAGKDKAEIAEVLRGYK